jgi:Uma2 family endonuclease
MGSRATAPATTPLKRRRFTVDEYHRMGEAGILTEDERVELIDGEVIEKTPIGWQHALCVARLNMFFAAALGDRVFIWPQNPLPVARYSEFQPDLALLTPPSGRYRGRLPAPADVVLVVEVADTSLGRDRLKLRRYARARIQETWLVDLQGEAIEAHRGPANDTYREVERVPRDGRLRLLAFPDLEVPVDEIIDEAG